MRICTLGIVTAIPRSGGALSQPRIWGGSYRNLVGPPTCARSTGDVAGIFSQAEQHQHQRDAFLATGQGRSRSVAPSAPAAPTAAGAVGSALGVVIYHPLSRVVTRLVGHRGVPSHWKVKAQLCPPQQVGGRILQGRIYCRSPSLPLTGAELRGDAQNRKHYGGNWINFVRQHAPTREAAGAGGNAQAPPDPQRLQNPSAGHQDPKA